MYWFSILILFLSACAPGVRYTLQENNDIFKPTKNRDANYTQGAQLSAIVPDSTGFHAYYAKHTIYTPVTTELDVPPKGERRYAGYAAAGYSKNIRDGIDKQHTLGAELGLIGPHAYGKQAQRTIHKLLRQTYPQGWDTQISDEPTAILTLETRRKFYFTPQLDFTSLVGVNLGNLFEQGYIGGTFRFGRNLPDSFIGGPIFPRQYSRENVSAYLFVTGLARAVARNLLLDGVEKKPLVGEARVGFTLEYEGYSFSYTYIHQTKEFTTEDDTMDFGEISVGVTW